MTVTALPRLALLIDADNASASLISEVIKAASQFGTVTIRRAFGDWTTPNLGGWKSQLHKNAIQPVQQFAYCTGKNATDSALIIDAMDVLYTQNVDGFCIVSSDSDFTRLATRLRESGKAVYGFGRKQACEAFVAACDQFTFVEDLNAPPAPPKVTPLVKADIDGLFTAAVQAAARGDAWADLSAVGCELRKSQPGFDPRIYGASSLSVLASRQKHLECRRVPDAPGSQNSHIEVRLQAANRPMIVEVAELAAA
jgi:uncharacterized LabA/DUF88 family protein